MKARESLAVWSCFWNYNSETECCLLLEIKNLKIICQNQKPEIVCSAAEDYVTSYTKFQVPES